MERLVKTFTIDLSKAIKADKPGHGSAVIAQLNVIDKDGDVTLPGAFGTQHVNMLPAHDRTAPRLGKAVLTEVDDMAVADFQFNLDKDAKTALEWYSSLKFDMENGDPLQEWSYGFEILEKSDGQFEGRPVQFLKSLKVFEISPVLRGAGVGTGTLAIKDDKNETYKQEMTNALASLADVERVLARAKSLAELRAKDGRVLSKENQADLQSLYTLLDEVIGKCKTVIDKAKQEDIAVDNLQAQFQKTLIRYGNLLGVNLQ